MYGAEYVDHLGPDPDYLAKQVETNADWFGQHVHGTGRTFLDVGCLEGTMLRVMTGRGWFAHGFDVIPESARRAERVTVAPWFHHELFPVMFDAVNCREVIEHVNGWRQMLVELVRSVAAGGLLQIQTPRPWTTNEWIPYQKGHLQLLTPAVLLAELTRIGMSVIESREWDHGQVHLMRRVDPGVF